MNEVQAKIYLVKYPSSLDDRTILHVFPEDYSRICGSVDQDQESGSPASDAKRPLPGVSITILRIFFNPIPGLQ